MSHDLSRWIEQAEARRFGEEAAFEQRLRPADAQYIHLGDRIVGVSRDFLATIGSHAVALVWRKPDHDAS